MKFIKLFFLFSLIILALLVTLVVTVDPYSKLGNNPWGFKTKAVAQSRENKFILFENSSKNYEAFILGSSTAHRFPMRVLKELTGFESFNYSAQHTNPEDYIAIIRHIFDKKKPKLILLEVGFIDMSENYKTDNRLFNSSLFKYLRDQQKVDTIFDNNYFTLDAIKDSFRVIFVNNFGKALHSNYREDGNYKYEPPVPGPVAIQQSSYPDWKLSKYRVELLAEIQKICDENNTRLIVFTAPLSYEHSKIAINTPGYPSFLEALTSTSKEVWNFHDESIKNYSTYKEFSNSTHMTEEFSALLLKRMLTGKPEIGKLITK